MLQSTQGEDQLVQSPENNFDAESEHDVIESTHIDNSSTHHICKRKNRTIDDGAGDVNIISRFRSI
jgi:hypothetical protein